MQSTTQEISPENWVPYFNRLSELYQGWRVTLEVLRQDMGDQPVADGPPLQGLSFETQGSEAGDILIETGDSLDDYMVHHVDRPTTVRLFIVQSGAETALQFESEDGTITILCLKRRLELPDFHAIEGR